MTQGDLLMIVFFPWVGGIIAYMVIFEFWDEHKESNDGKR